MTAHPNTPYEDGCPELTDFRNNIEGLLNLFPSEFSPISGTKTVDAEVEKLIISPNPASEFVKIEFAGSPIQSLGLFDVTGRNITLPSGSTTTRINRGTLPAGIYTCVARLEDGKQAFGRFLFQ